MWCKVRLGASKFGRRQGRGEEKTLVPVMPKKKQVIASGGGNVFVGHAFKDFCVSADGESTGALARDP